MPNYKNAPEIREIAEELIEEHHPHLEGQRIEYAFVDKATTKNGKTVLGKCSLESGKTAHFLRPGREREFWGMDEKFFFIQIPQAVWDSLDEKQRTALVDHELSHAGIDPETEEPCLLPHDLEEFGAVVTRHGLWLDDVRKFVEAANAAQEPELPFSDSEGMVARSFEGAGVTRDPVPA